MVETKMKKLLALALTLVMILSLLSACQNNANNDPSGAPSQNASGEESQAPVSETGRYPELQVAVSHDMEDLTPYLVNGLTRSNVFWEIYESLFDFDDEMNFIPNLATGYTAVSDTEWDIELYHNIHDSQGNAITADDVVFCVNWLVDTGNNIRYNLFDSIEKVDEYTVRYHWTQKPASTSDLEWPLCRTFIFDTEAWENNNFAVAPVATGSYVVESFTAGSNLVLAANENYWADQTDEDVSGRASYHAANIDRIVYNTLTESSSAVVGLQMGNVDFCDYVPVSMLGDFQEGGQHSDKYNVEVMETTDYYYLLPNLSAENTVMSQDPNLRMAIYYALNNDLIAAVMGSDTLPLKTLGTAAFSDFDEAWESEPNYINTCDLDKAKEYLSKSSYKGEELVIMGLASEDCKNALTMIQNQLIDDLGLNVKIQPYEETLLLNAQVEKTGWDFYLASTGGNTLVSSWERIFSQEQNNGYTASWLQDDKLETLFRTAAADDTRSAQTIKECLDYAFEIGCVYGLSMRSSSLVYSKDISSICYREGYWTCSGFEFAG